MNKGNCQMRVLLYLEPVVFRQDPLYLIPHTGWFRHIVSRNSASARFAFASSPMLCAYLEARLTQADVTYYGLNPWELTEPFSHRRDHYAAALYPPYDPDDRRLDALKQRLLSIRTEFEPELVVSSSQNVLLETVFSGVPQIYIEQAPVPRTGGHGIMSFDPFGHQSGGLLNRVSPQVLAADQPIHDCERIMEQWGQATAPKAPADIARQTDIAAEISALRGKQRVAAFAMQPPDWLTYEGAYEPISPEDLIVRWAGALPEGWVGVPFFHAAHALDRGMLEAIARWVPNLALLPDELTRNALDIAVPHIDGLVTISSTAALGAMLAGKIVAVTGKSPFSSYALNDPASLCETATLSVVQRAQLAVLLTSSFCQRADIAFTVEDEFLRISRKMQEAKAEPATLLDFGQWCPERLPAFFAPLTASFHDL